MGSAWEFAKVLPSEQTSEPMLAVATGRKYCLLARESVMVSGLASGPRLAPRLGSISSDQFLEPEWEPAAGFASELALGSAWEYAWAQSSEQTSEPMLA